MCRFESKTDLCEVLLLCYKIVYRVSYYIDVFQKLSIRAKAKMYLLSFKAVLVILFISDSVY